MSRIIVKFNDTNQYVNLKADDMHEDDGYLKVYNGNELVGIFELPNIKTAYRTEQVASNDNQRSY